MNEAVIPINAIISRVDVSDRPIDGPNHTIDGNCLKASDNAFKPLLSI